jgi:hypothetical protein
MEALQNRQTVADIIRKEFFDEIENRVSLYVERNFASMEFQSYRVDRVDEAHVQDQSLHRVIPYDSIGNTLAFDAVVIAEIAIYQVDSHLDVEDSVSKWFRVSCEVDINEGFSNFRIINVDDEYDSNVNEPREMLDDNLIPIVYTADLERHAEGILEYAYPEALLSPKKVDVRLFAERLGLSIIEKRLSRNGTIFGQMIFHETTVEYFDLERRGFQAINAARGTILADPEVYFLRNIGSWNNTIIHECVHWLKHRRYIELKRHFNENVSRIACQVAESPPETGSRKRTDLEWMEWHANAIAPRILMPRKPFKEKADEFIAWHKQNNSMSRLAEILPAVIAELSIFFEVSIQSARIRLLDIGYSEAIGVMEYVDGQYVPPHSFKAGALGEKQTFTVPMKDGLLQSAINPAFAAVLAKGDFVYIDGHYVINAPQYVSTSDFGILEMTDYALANMDECCLSFERSTRPNPDYNVKSYTECVLYQSATAKTITDYDYKGTDNDKEVIARAATLRAELEDVKAAAKIAEDLPGSFGKSLVLLMKWRGINIEKLGEKALLDTRMIQRMRNDDTRNWDIKKLVAVCVGLNLPPALSLALIDKAGLKFRPGEEQFICAQILSTRYNSTIHECNELLELAGFSPLSGSE